MLKELTDKKWVVDQLKKVLNHIENSPETAKFESAPPELAGLHRPDFSDVRDDIKRSLSKQETVVQKIGLEAMESPTEEPGGDAYYIGKDEVTSNLQSATEYVAARKTAQTSDSTPQGAGKFEALDKFGESDVGWISSLVAMGIRKFKLPHAWPAKSPPEIPLADNARIILFADWGSGIERAQRVINHARGYVDESLKDGRQTGVIHLGDVYYSGYGWEYEQRFLPYWPVRPEEAGQIPSISLNGNHDMYAGGYGYFDVLLKEKRFAPWHQDSSTVLLTNRSWRILGLDTAYEDHGLHGTQDEWIRKQMSLAKENGQKVMLLSHHQPFSLYEPPGSDNALRSKINPIIKQSGLHTWFWGHEHRCVLYEAFEGTRNGRCIGHAGVPVYLWKQKRATAGQPNAAYEYRDAIRRLLGLEKFAIFGFLVLDFAPAGVRVRYVNEFGVEHYEEQIS